MKKMMMTTLKTSLVTLSLLFSATTFASGEGRNGPDQSGVSIPVTLDRALTSNKFAKAVAACDQESAKSLVEQMIQQKIQGFTPTRPNIYTFQLNESAAIFQILYGSTLTTENNTLGQSQRGFFQLYSSTQVEGSIMKFNVTDKTFEMIWQAAAQVAFYTGGFTINVTFAQDSYYDGMGTLHTEEILVEKYSVSSAPILRAPGIKTSLKLDIKEFTQCLENHSN